MSSTSWTRKKQVLLGECKEKKIQPRDLKHSTRPITMKPNAWQSSTAPLSGPISIYKPTELSQKADSILYSLQNLGQ